jgi:hypothetical protein
MDRVQMDELINSHVIFRGFVDVGEQGARAEARVRNLFLRSAAFLPTPLTFGCSIAVR